MCCSGCKSVFYCSEAHQVEHWITHASECSYSEKSSEYQDSFSVVEEPKVPHPAPDNTFVADEEVYTSRYKVRKEILSLYSQENYSLALPKARSYFTRVLAEYERNSYFDIYDLLSDGVLLSRGYIYCGELNQARQILLQVYALMISHSSSHQFSNTSNFKTDEAKGEKVNLTYSQLKTKTSAYSVLGALLCACGDTINAEKMYVQYTKLFEVYLNSDSLETSNCYFMLGLFYKNQGLLQKSLAAFRKSLEVRIQHFGESHETVADCYFNIGLLYKAQSFSNKALASLQKSLMIRTERCSEKSLPVADVLEALGALYMSTQDYKSAYEKLAEAYNIRKSLLKHCPDHSDLHRTTSLLSELHSLVEQESSKEHYKRAEMSMFNPIFTPDTSPIKTSESASFPFQESLGGSPVKD